MNEFQQAVDGLQQDSTFVQWKKRHHNAFLSHFFCQVTPELDQKSAWEIGYYDLDTDKITSFREIDEKTFEIKPEDEVFKKDSDVVEELDVTKIDFSLEKAQEIWKKNFPSLFGHEVMGEGFIVLQTLQGKVLWNISCVSKTLKFLNMKIDANSGELASHDAIELVDKGKV